MDTNKSSSIEQQNAQKEILVEVEKWLGISLLANPKIFLADNAFTYMQPNFYSKNHNVIGEIFTHIGKPKKRRIIRLQMIFLRCYY